MEGILKPPVGYETAGAVVMRAFTTGGEKLTVGRVMLAGEFNAIPDHARRNLIKGDWVMPFYLPTGGPQAAAVPAATEADRFLIHRGSGKYDVVEGAQLNDKPLTRAEADALAGR